MYISRNNRHIDTSVYRKGCILVNVISSYIGPADQLKGPPRNPRTMLWRCPFHNEKTPSFRLFKMDKGGWGYKCFGCGESGDVFIFIMKKEHGCCFPKALRIMQKMVASSSFLRRHTQQKVSYLQMKIPFPKPLINTDLAFPF
jgi:DNA primase